MAPTSKENLVWSKPMDDALVDAFMNEYNCGHRVNGTFTSTAYDNIVKELSALFGSKIDKEKIKNRWKTLKKNFAEVYDLFKNGMSGFAWDPTTCMWDAEPQVWDALIQAHPRAAMWRNTPLPNYEKMATLYGNARATGNERETLSQMKKRKHSSTEDLFHDSIDDIDNMVSQNEATLGNYDCFINDDSLDAQQEDDSPRISSACNNKKRRTSSSKDKDVEISEYKSTMSELIDVLRQSNSIMERAISTPTPLVPPEPEELLTLIEGCGCEAEKVPKIFTFFMKNVEEFNIITKCRPQMRKAVIMELVYGAGN